MSDLDRVSRRLASEAHIAPQDVASFNSLNTQQSANQYYFRKSIFYDLIIQSLNQLFAVLSHTKRVL